MFFNALNFSMETFEDKINTILGHTPKRSSVSDHQTIFMLDKDNQRKYEMHFIN